MSASAQPPTPGATPCGTCGAPLAPDQRYCLTCGTRRGEPRVAETELAAPPTAVVEPRQSDVSPLAAVIGIALLGGMLLIGVLIGRSSSDDNSAPAPVVQVGQPSTTTPDTTADAPADTGATTVIGSEWPAGTDGFTIQLDTVSKDGATPESVDAAKQSAVAKGATDAAVLDSDLYSSLPPGNWVIYSGVYTDRKSAEVALKGLGSALKGAAVVEVSDGGADSPAGGRQAAPTGQPPGGGQAVPGAGGEAEAPRAPEGNAK